MILPQSLPSMIPVLEAVALPGTPMRQTCLWYQGYPCYGDCNPYIVLAILVKEYHR
jgi:hypothetical protein